MSYAVVATLSYDSYCYKCEFTISLTHSLVQDWNYQNL